jgi:HK97 family phage portal protein
VIVRTESGAKRELFAGFDSSVPIPRPSMWGSTTSLAGERITLESAAGLPAFLRGLRLLSETSAGLPICLYRGYGSRRRPVEGASQLGILRRPNPHQTRFGMWQYTFGCLPGFGNAYLYKVKANRQVRFLYPVNPKFVVPDYTGAEPVFGLKDREYGPVVQEVGRDRVIHIPGILLTDPYVGVSVVEAERNAIGVDIARQRFESRHISNDGRPGVVLKNPGMPTQEQRDEIRAGYESRHNAANPGRLGMVWGGWDITTLPVSLEDQQFVDTKQFSVREVANMLGIPAGLLGDPDAPSGVRPDQENMRFLTYGLRPWMDRVEDALEQDSDLFSEPDWEVEFDEAGFLRADILTRYEAYRTARQGGWKTPNEIRADEGLEPAEGGDEIQETPVGGAPNSAGGESAPQD